MLFLLVNFCSQHTEVQSKLMRTASKLTGDVYDENQVLCLQYIFCFCLFCEMALDGNSTRIVSVYRSASGMI